MESGAHKLLESAVQRTLHAHAFSRSSSQASSVLTDLLSRYLILLTSTCAKYSQHAGRTGLTVRDAMGALDELGVSVEELSEYCATEGKELNRYALYSARRVEDLHEFKSQLSEGLKQDHDDAIPLEYAYCPPELLQDEEEDEEEEYSADEDEDDEAEINAATIKSDMDLDSSPSRAETLQRKRPPSRPTTPTLPLSPISNPSSPQRKRTRANSWQPPEHIPDFLPPFPTILDDLPPSPMDNGNGPLSHAQPVMHPPPTQIPEVKIEKPPVTLSQSLTSAAASDILVQVPYSQSSLSSVPEWHLPSNAPPPLATQTRQNRLPTPLVEPSLFSAYHHILTHPPPPELPPLNPPRHKVAMALMKQAQSNRRWNPADTLFGSVGPCAPRVATIGPTYPIANTDLIGNEVKPKGDGPDKDPKLPITVYRPVAGSEPIAPLISQQTSRIPELARHILPPTILTRTSRLSHPPVLHRGSKPLVYGSGIAAPWNANATPGPDGAPSATPTASKSKETPSSNTKDSPVKPVLPDARMFATWEYEPKDFKVSLNPPVRGRNRIGSIQASGSGLISLPVSSRSKGVK